MSRHTVDLEPLRALASSWYSKARVLWQDTRRHASLRSQGLLGVSNDELQELLVSFLRAFVLSALIIITVRAVKRVLTPNAAKACSCGRIQAEEDLASDTQLHVEAVGSGGQLKLQGQHLDAGQTSPTMTSCKNGNREDSTDGPPRPSTSADDPEVLTEAGAAAADDNDATTPAHEAFPGDVSFGLPDSSSYSAIIDESMPRADISTLTTSESFVLPAHRDSPDVAFASSCTKPERLSDTEDQPLELPPATPGLKPEEMSPHLDVQFKLTITEAPSNPRQAKGERPTPPLPMVPGAIFKRLLSVENVGTNTAATPGRGRGPSFIPSIEATEVLQNQTNTQGGPLTRSQSKTRIHTTAKPDWAVAPDSAENRTRITRSTSARSAIARGKGRRRPADVSDADSHQVVVLASSRIVEVNGKWARGGRSGRGRGRGQTQD